MFKKIKSEQLFQWVVMGFALALGGAGYAWVKSQADNLRAQA